MNVKLTVVSLSVAAIVASCGADDPTAGPVNPGLAAPGLAITARGETDGEPSADQTALSLKWDNPSKAKIDVEMSQVETFRPAYTFGVADTEQAGVDFTFAELNDILLKGLGMEASLQATLYIRLAASAEGDTALSNVATVAVTPGAIINPAELTTSAADLTLTASKPDKLALSLSWTKNGRGVSSAIEFGTTRDFALPYSQAVAPDTHDRQYTFGALNAICDSLGMTADEPDSLYVRIVSSFATSAVASNVLALQVTPMAEDTPAGVNVLWVCGLDETGDWEFNNYLMEYDAMTRSYAGVHWVDSQWGYRFYPTKDNWDYYFTRSSGDAIKGTLQLGGNGNMYKPEAGHMYFFDVSLGKYSYQLVETTSLSYAGFGDDWTVRKMSQPDPKVPVYTATVTVAKPTPYRWQVLVNGSWDYKFSATGNHLLLNNDGDADTAIENGVYSLTVDMSTCTYTLIKLNYE